MYININIFIYIYLHLSIYMYIYVYVYIIYTYMYMYSYVVRVEGFSVFGYLAGVLIVVDVLALPKLGVPLS